MGIRKAEGDDGQHVLRLLTRLGYDVQNERGRAVYRRLLKDEDQAIVVFEEGGQVLGMIGLSIRPQLHHCGPVATIDELVVDEQARGRGIGTALLREAIALARQRGCDVVEVMSAHHRTRAHEFYLSQGFVSYGLKLVCVVLCKKPGF